MSIRGGWVLRSQGVYAERFHRTLADGWAYARFYSSDVASRDIVD